MFDLLAAFFLLALFLVVVGLMWYHNVLTTKFNDYIWFREQKARANKKHRKKK